MQAVASFGRAGARVSSRLVSTCGHIRMLHRSNAFRQSLIHDILDESSRRPLVIYSTTTNPYANLAFEHHILAQAHPASRILLFYTNRPCVVIGRNQNPWSECNLSLLKEGLHGQSIDLVRRRSGGGTVFHDQGNLNFSIVVPNDKNFTRKVHAEMVVKAIKATSPKLADVKLFDDVWVNERHDIVIQKQGRTYKVSGSAFKLTRGRALHHGTLLHTSPNLNNISKFLRSPGAAFIQAKGVESVRSPVSNLYNVPERQSIEIQQTITGNVVEQFANLYGSISEFSVSHDQIARSVFQEGSDELQSDEWKFNQTPRFTFESPLMKGQQLSMSVNHGVVEEASVNDLVGLKLAEIQDWSIVQFPALHDWLQETFPYVANDVSTNHGTSSTVVEDREQVVQRRLDNGTVEVERPINTIEVR